MGKMSLTECMRGCAEDETCTSFLCLGSVFSAGKSGCGLMIYIKRFQTGNSFCFVYMRLPSFSIEVKLVLTSSFQQEAAGEECSQWQKKTLHSSSCENISARITIRFC